MLIEMLKSLFSNTNLSPSCALEEVELTKRIRGMGRVNDEDGRLKEDMMFHKIRSEIDFKMHSPVLFVICNLGP
jgi:hypothetical protein